MQLQAELAQAAATEIANAEGNITKEALYEKGGAIEEFRKELSDRVSAEGTDLKDKMVLKDIEAGYEKDSAYVRASELRNPKKYPLVVQYIGEIREEYQKKYEVTYERHIAELGKIRQEALKKGAFSAANNAEVARGKAAGLYVEQKIIRTGKLDDMSKDEMERELKSILDEYSPLLQDVTPEDVKEKVKEKRLPRVKKLN